MSSQLDKWKGRFGEEYTQRNEFDWRERVDPFRSMLTDIDVEKILEVGCNRGYNLIAISKVLNEKANLVGIEPNMDALKVARKSSSEIGFLEGSAYDIPLKNGYFDLCFTSGVLIHVPPEKIDTAISEICRVSKQYILSIEYYSEEEKEVEYRGEKNMLWKRDFLRCYKSQFPDISLVRKGYWGPEDGFDRCHWWLLKK